MLPVSNRSPFQEAAARRFEEAHRKALITALMDAIRGRSEEMLSFDEVRARLNVRGQRSIGHQVVPLDHIVGSEGRYGDFDRRFLPRSRALKARWSSVSRAMLEEVNLPPVELYKIGDIYFVRDGNHRVSAAREQGQEFIDAYVTELIVDVPLDPRISVRDLILKEEYSDFLEWTDLHCLRPDERIEFSCPGGYLDLVRHINQHRYYMGIDLQRPIERDEAVSSWYDNVYMPVIRAIRARGVLDEFPGRTEADLYRWIMEHRAQMQQRLGLDPGPEQATSDYVDHAARGSLPGVIDQLLHDLRDRLRP
jgi:hypothetical protein